MAVVTKKCYHSNTSKFIFLNFYSSDRNDYNRRRQGGLSISEYPESGIYGRHRQNIGYADYSEPIEPLSLDTAEGTEGGTISESIYNRAIS